MTLKINKIRWQNFLSTGNQLTEVVVDQNRTTLIVGENGSGKSTIMDAVCFGLFNKPFRKINKSQLVNSITSKNSLVEVEFETTNRKYLIRRGLKPNIFEIYQDGTLINQSSESKDYQQILEQNILKINYKTFCQIVVLGSANFTPFMQLPAPQRRQIIEDLLDIQIFSTMNSILKTNISQNKEEILENEKLIDVLKTKISINKKHSEQLKQDLINVIAEKEQDIASKQKIIDSNNERISVLSEKIKELEQAGSGRTDLLNKMNEFKRVESKINRRIELSDETIKFYSESSNCPTCKQEITEEFKHTQINSHEQNKISFAGQLEKLDLVYKTLLIKQKTFEDIFKKISILNDEFHELNIANSINNGMIQSHRKEIAGLSNKKIPIDDITEIEQQLQEASNIRQELLEKRELNNIAVMLLKDDGIKTYIIKQYVPVINQLINSFLDQMDFFCQFEINEQFEEKIKSHYRDEFSYESFSEGEKMRVDLALLFTWREISRLRNSTKINLLILDEIMDSSLDSSGTEEFIKIVNQLTTDNNVIVISHKHEQISDKFDHVIKFQKIKNFSRIVG